MTQDTHSLSHTFHIRWASWENQLALQCKQKQSYVILFHRFNDPIHRIIIIIYIQQNIFSDFACFCCICLKLNSKLCFHFFFVSSKHVIWFKWKTVYCLRNISSNFISLPCHWLKFKFPRTITQMGKVNRSNRIK